MWNAKTGDPYGSSLGADTSPVGDVEFGPDGRTLVSAHVRSAVVWDMSGRQAIGEPLDGGTDLTTDMAFSPDGKLLVVGRYGGDVLAVRHGDAPTDAPPRCGLDRHCRRARPGRQASRDRDDRRSGSARRPGDKVERRASAGRRGAQPSGRWRSARTAGCSRSPWIRTVAGTASTSSSDRARSSSGTLQRGVGWGGDCAGRGIGHVPGLEPGWELLATGGGQLDLWDGRPRCATDVR